MKLAQNIILLLILMFPPALVVMADGEPPAGSVLDRFTPEQKEKLLAGEAIYESVIEETPEGKDRAHGRTVVIVNKPIKECFLIFCEFDKQYLYYPRMTMSKVLKQKDNTVLIYYELDYVITTVRYTQILTIDPDRHQVSFTIDPTGMNDVKATDGFYRFDKIDENRSLFTYEVTKMDAGVKIPDFIREFISSKDLPGIAISLKKWIESGGKWKK
jgi:hypothetical protein